MRPERTASRAALAGWAAVALAAGLLHALSFGLLAHWSLGLLSLLLLFTVLQQASAAGSGRRRVMLLTGLFGLAHFGLGLSWLHHSMHHIGGMPFALSVLAVLLFAAYLSLFPAVAFGLVHGRMLRAVSPVPAALVLAASWWLAEAARGWLFTGFPWLSVGYGQIEGPLAGWAAITGVHGVSALAVFIAALAARRLTPEPLRLGTRFADRRAARGRWPRLQTLGLVSGLLLTSHLIDIGPQHWVRPHGEPLQVQLLQGNVPQDLKFNPQRTLQAMNDYLQAFEGSQARLTLMPETAWTVPWSMTPPEIARRLLAHVQNGHALAIGLPRWAPDSGRPANSVMLLAPHGDPARAPLYDKHHLVPFGEFIPWGFGWFVRQMQIPMGDFVRGAPVQSSFEVGGQKVAMNICYEDLFGEEIRLGVLQAQASVLANVSNLGWFGRSSALDQHLAISRFRSIETGRPMLRATNTGMTAAIDHRGQVLVRLAPHVEGALDATVQGMQGLTPYARFGQAPWLVGCALGLALMAFIARRRPPE